MDAGKVSYPADFPHRQAALAGKLLEILELFFRDAEQQSAAGLWVKKQHLVGVFQGRVKADLGAKPEEIIAGAAGEGVGVGIFASGTNEGDLLERKFQTDLAGLGDFAGVPEQAETGDVGDGLELAIQSQLSSLMVEAFHPGADFAHFLFCGQAFFEGGGGDAKAQRFADEEVISWFGAALGQDFFGFSDADGHQSEFWLVIGDSVTTSNDHTRLAAFFSRPADDGFGNFLGQVGRKSGDVERQERLCAHGVDIGEAVCGSDGTVIVRIVDYRGEEIGGDHQGMALVQLPDSGIVCRIQSDQKLGIIGRVEGFLDWLQNLRQRLRVELGRSARAAGETGEADLLAVVVLF